MLTTIEKLDAAHQQESMEKSVLRSALVLFILDARGEQRKLNKSGCVHMAQSLDVEINTATNLLRKHC